MKKTIKTFIAIIAFVLLISINSPGYNYSTEHEYIANDTNGICLLTENKLIIESWMLDENWLIINEEYTIEDWMLNEDYLEINNTEPWMFDSNYLKK